MNCPKCGKDLIERRGRYGKFIGCTGFPKCKYTAKVGRRTGGLAKPPVRPTAPRNDYFKPNRFQKEIFARGQDVNGGNLVVHAGPGTGKTTTEEQFGWLLPKDVDILYAVFNAHSRDEALERMPAWMTVQTTHQVGLVAVSKHVGKRPEIDKKKMYYIIKSLVDWENERWMISPVQQIVGLLKNNVLEATVENIEGIVEHHGIDTNGHFNHIVSLAREALRLSNADLSVIDFDDMIYLPSFLNLPMRKYDWVLLDEVQDFNQAQIDLTLKSVKPTGRVLAVGDENQSMYGFRGAALDAMDQVRNALNAEILPLSITYRCPRSHVELVNYLFPHAVLEAAPNAKEGEVVSLSMEKMMGTVKDGDMVLCRTNAPLVAPCFELIRRGVKAVIRGRDIGEGLVNLIKKFDEQNVTKLLAALKEYQDREVAKLMAVEKGSQAQNLLDRVMTIVAFSDGCKTANEIVTKIEEVFSDKKSGVVFSSIHKAKGLEADNIFILEPHLLPHPMAKKDWEVAQEINIAFVAMTRSKNTLGFVGEIPSIPFSFSGLVDADDFDMEAYINEVEEEIKRSNLDVEWKSKPNYWGYRN